MLNLHAIAAIDYALSEIRERSIVFAEEATNLLTPITERLRLSEGNNDFMAFADLTAKLAEINDPALKAAATAATVKDSVVPTSKLTDFLLDLRNLLANGSN